MRKIPALTLLLLAALTAPALAQTVSIPDPGLNAAVREALQKPAGPLTEQDLLRLTNFNACCREVSNLQGLEAARNLRFLDLNSNSLTNLVLPNAWTNLETLSLFLNRLTNLVVPGALAKLNLLDVGFNSLAQCSLPAGMTNLDTLFLEGNQLTSLTLPTGLIRLAQLDLAGNQLTSFVCPPDMTNLGSLLVFANRLTNVTLPPNLKRLASLDLASNRLRQLEVPAGLTNLSSLVLLRNELTNLVLPPDLTKLSFLDLADNQINHILLPPSLRNLNFLRLSGNKLTDLTFPPGLTNLSAVFLRSNQLATLTLSPGLTRLVQIDVAENQLTNLTLPPDLAQLITLGLEGNPLATLVLSEPVAATNLPAVVSQLRNLGVSVFTYPLSIQLVRLLPLAGAFKFGITGPPGDYAVFGSSNLKTWNFLSTVKNPLGAINFTDVTANSSPHKFYRVLLQGPPTNMVFIPPNTFTMGSPSNDITRSIFEGPQATVTLTRGFWIGKYEVTQGEYLAVTGENPSNFPGDLNRPVSSVSWFDATNYCAKLTQRELAAGRISPGSRYRLPTEAEWECAARAGTTTQFSYGDDPFFTSLTNYAWFLDLGHPDLIVHPVGQKLPNPWGLYDMAGNVWEWCLDWYGDQTGGVQVDPIGPASNPRGDKVMRGGAYDYPDSSCRSAARLFFFALFPDTDLGFRVVLDVGP